MQQRARNLIQSRRDENRCSGDSDRRLVGTLEEKFCIDAASRSFFTQDAPACVPGIHQNGYAGRNQQRKPAAFDKFQCVGRKEG